MQTFRRKICFHRHSPLFTGFKILCVSSMVISLWLWLNARTSVKLAPASINTASSGGAASVNSVSSGGAASVNASSFGGAASVNSASSGGAASVNTSSFGGAAAVNTSSFGGAASVNSASSGGAASVNTSSPGGADSVKIAPSGSAASVNHGASDDLVHGAKHYLNQDSYFVPNTPGHDWHGTYKPFYFFIYSAFYDDRPYHKNKPQVNIYGLIKNKELRDLKLLCVFRYNGTAFGTGSREKSSIPGAFTANSPDKTSDGINVCTFMLWCPTVDEQIPTGVNILLQQPNKTAIQLASSDVEVMPKVEKKRPLAACVCALYAPEKSYLDHVHPFAIVQWVEMQRIMGVDHVTVYVYSISVSVLMVLEYYTAIGYVTLRSIGPVDSDPYKQPRFTSITDCMQRYMYSHHNVLVIDFDEVIVPREDISLPELVKQQSRGRHVHLQFQNVMFFTDGPFQESSEPDYFSFLRTRLHKAPTSFPGPMKSIQDPSVCPFGTNHRCLLDSRTVYINYTIAASHHYKACQTTRSHPWDCRKEMAALRPDDIMLRYEDRLVPAVQRVVKSLEQTYGQDFFKGRPSRAQGPP